MQFLQNWEEFGRGVAVLIARSWDDPQFREEFIRDPRTKLVEADLILPETVEVRVDPSQTSWKLEPGDGEMESFGRLIYTIPLPPRPAELSGEELGGLARPGAPTVRGGSCC